MARFVAFDVETPNRWNDRMSAIGITIVEDGEVVEEFYSLVDPEEPFDSFNVQLTGIDEQAVWGQPNFGELWPVIEPLMSSGMLLAHNAVFDLGVLGKCLKACDAGAILGKPKFVHVINQKKCTQCNQCLEACPEGAIVRAGAKKPKTPPRPIPCRVHA